MTQRGMEAYLAALVNRRDDHWFTYTVDGRPTVEVWQGACLLRTYRKVRGKWRKVRKRESVHGAVQLADAG